MREKLEEYLKELDSYPQEEIKNKIDMYINTWRNCSKDEAIFLIGLEQGLEMALKLTQEEITI